MSVIIAIAAIGFIAWTIYQQVTGATLDSRRVVILPAILTVVGIVDVTATKAHATPTDDVIIAVGAVIAVLIGLGLGVMTRIRAKDGYLWGQLPKSGLYLWAAFFASHIGLMALAHGLGAHVAAGTDAILLSVGLNRLAQAAVVVPRAMAAGIPFAPDKNGRSFGAGWSSNVAGVTRPASARTTWNRADVAADPDAISTPSVPVHSDAVSSLRTAAFAGAGLLADRRAGRSRRHARRF